MEKTDRENIYRKDAGLVNCDHDGLSAYKRKKQRYREIQENKERLDRLEPKVDEILNILKGNQS